MRKIREVLRLRFELGLGQREIARACSISQSTVHEYLQRAAAAGIVWPLNQEWDEASLNRALFGERQPAGRLPQQVLPDFSRLHRELQQHRHLTLQLAWEEYRQAQPQGYGCSRFCELYGRWRRKQDVVLRQQHTPGEKGFVDWAGTKIPVHDPKSGEVWFASLFVMVLGASSYTFAEATRDQQITRHGETLGFYIPAQKRNRRAELQAMRAAAKDLDEMIAAWGASEDELMDEFKQICRSAREKKRNAK